jgi:hypothetical protein
MRTALLALLAGLAAGPAFAQREAISPDLTPEAAARIFQDTVVNACLPAASGGGVAALSQAVRNKLRASTDPETRRQTGAGADETIWDVLDGKGVVTVHEKAGRCVVSVYGPPAGPTMIQLTTMMTAAGFEALAGVGPAMQQRLTKEAGGKRVTVVINGSEPGMPGHRSRFPLVTATVLALPAG